MSAAVKGSEECRVEAETSIGSASTEREIDVTEKSNEVAPSSSGEATQEDLLGHSECDGDKGEILLDGTVVPESYSDFNDDFVMDLPTDLGVVIKPTPAKDVVVEGETIVADEGKSEKIVPLKATIKSTDIVKASHPPTNMIQLVVEKENVAVETELRLHDEAFVKDLCHITLMTKSQFRDNSHWKSGRYYLPELPLLSDMDSKSGLLVAMAVMASLYPCGATYQCCYSEIIYTKMICISIKALKN